MNPKSNFHFFLFFTLILDLAGLPLLSVVHGADEYPLDVSPPWLKVGTYVEYEVTVLVNGAPKRVLRWECISLEGNVATLNISLPARASYPGFPSISPPSPILRILTDTREVIAENGSVMGKTYLWVPPFMKDNQEFLAEGTESDGIVCTVNSSKDSSVHTHCQGFQEVMYIQSVHSWKNMCFDIDRGILIMGDIPSAVLGALGVGGSIDSASTIHDTNIDLGPVYWRTTILTFLWQNLPWEILIVLFATTLLLYRRRRRKHRARTDVMEKLRHV